MVIRKDTLREACVCISIVVFYFSTIVFKMSTLQEVLGVSCEELYNALHIVVYVILVFSIFLRGRFNAKLLLIYLVLLSICIFSYINLRLLYFIDIVIFMVATENISDKKIVASVAGSVSISVLLVIFMAKSGIIENLSHLKDFDLNTMTYSMGFQEINWLGALLLEFFLAWIYLRYDKLGIADLILGIVTFIYLKNTSFSRTALYLIVIVPVVIVIFKIIHHFDLKNKFMTFTTIFMLLPAIVSFAAVAFYTPRNHFFYILNILTTNRVSLMNLQLKEYGISLFGQMLTNVSAFDNAYVRCGVWYGMVLLVTYVLGQITISRWAVKNDNVALYILMIVFAIQGIVESFPLFLRFNFTYLLYANILTSIWKKRKMMGDNTLLNN